MKIIISMLVFALLFCQLIVRAKKTMMKEISLLELGQASCFLVKSVRNMI